jgi:hypothetical protein
MARWQIVSTTPDRAMLKPDMPYDDLAVMTGSVTLDNGTPTTLYSCHGSGNKKKGWSSSIVALATAANLSDPLLLWWTKDPSNPVLFPRFKPAGMPLSNGFRDSSTAWMSGGKWRFLTACQGCNGSKKPMLGLFSAAQLAGPWEFTSLPLQVHQLECPDYWPVVPVAPGVAVVDGVSVASLSAIKLSHGGKEIVYVRTMDTATQMMTKLVVPLVSTGSDKVGTQLLDAETYASTSSTRSRSCTLLLMDCG